MSDSVISVPGAAAQSAARALADSEARYHALVAATAQFVWRRGAHGVTDPDTDAWWEVATGQGRDEANAQGGLGWISLLHPDDRERARTAWADAFANRATFDTEYRVLTPSGSYRHLAVRGVPVGDDPSAGEWIGTFTDITPQREAEAQREALLHAERAARERTEVLQRITAAFSAARTRVDVARAVLDAGVTGAGVPIGTVALLTNDGAAFEQIAEVGLGDVDGAAWSRYPNAGRLPAVDAVRTGRPVVLESRDAILAGYPVFESGAVRLNINAAIVLPIPSADGGPMGVVSLNFHEPRTVGGDELAFLETLARLCGQAMERARLYEVEREARRTAEQVAIERAASEAQLRAEVARRTQLVATLEQATDFVGIADLEGRAIYVNPTARRLVGLADDVRAEDTEIVDYFPPEWRARVRDEILPQLLRDGQWRGEVRFRHFQTGEEIPVEWNPFVVRDATTGEPIALSCVARDLRTERAAQVERERLLAEAEAANRAKSDFLAVMSHELRTPLNAIAGYVDLLDLGLRGPVTDAQRADLHRVRTAQRTLLRHVNDVLNFAKLEAGRVEFDVGDVEVRRLLADVEPFVEPQATAKQVSYECAACDAALVARADADKAGQVLINLVANAVKFTPPGGRVTVSAATHDEDWISIRVHDTGVGIPREKLARVFDPFVQVHERGHPRQEGTGLGLAISRDLVRGMGGELLAESEAGKGSVFTVRLPRAAASEGQPAAADT